MKITYSIHKSYPDVQYVATLDPLPMATANPEFTEAKITKKRLDKKGITVVEDKEMQINILLLFWYFLRGMTLRQIVEKRSKHEYSFNHQVTPITNEDNLK